MSFATQLIITDVYPNVWKLFRFKVSTTYTLFICAEGGALWEFESCPSLCIPREAGISTFWLLLSLMELEIRIFQSVPVSKQGGVTESNDFFAKKLAYCLFHERIVDLLPQIA